jgi:hypothetical protein
MERAVQALGLNEQERALYQHHLNNLNGPGGVDNADGSRSTVRQMAVGIDGKTYNLPTVWNGKVLPPKEAIAQAEKIGFDKFPFYDSEAEAEGRYQAMHGLMEDDTATYLAGRK